MQLKDVTNRSTDWLAGMSVQLKDVTNRLTDWLASGLCEELCLLCQSQSDFTLREIISAV